MKVNIEGKTEFDRFNNLVKRLVAVRHSEIKAKLDAEKRAKERRKKRKPKTSSSARASGS